MIHKLARTASARSEQQPGPTSRSGHDSRSYTTTRDTTLDGAKHFIETSVHGRRKLNTDEYLKMAENLLSFGEESALS